MARSTTEVTIGAPGSPVLEEFMADRSRVGMIMGPLGSGKTTGALQKILAISCEQAPNPQGVRPTRWLCVRNTYSDLFGTTIKDFQEVFRGFGKLKIGSMEPPTFHMHAELPDGTKVDAEFIFLALDRDDAVRKLRGYQLTGVYFNETKEMARSIIMMSDLRIGRYPSMVAGGVAPTWYGLIGDTNSMDTDHYYHNWAEEDTPVGWRFFRQPGGVMAGEEPDTWEVNPYAENVDNLPAGYYETGVQGKTQDWIRVNLGNEYAFTTDGLAVHPEYVDSVHTSQGILEADRRFPLTLGLDFGRTPACAITQWNPEMARWAVIDEMTSEGISSQLFAPELKLYLDRVYPGFQYELAWSDPAGEARGQATEDTPIAIMRAHGIPAEAVASNSPLLRRQAVSNPATRVCMDGKPGLIVSPKAKMIRKGLMGGFCYRRLRVSGTERYTDQPDKNVYSHPVEALEYALMGGGEGQAALIPRSSGGPAQTDAVM